MIELIPIFIVHWYCDVLKRILTIDNREMCSIIKDHISEVGKMVDEGKLSDKAATILLLCSFISCLEAGERLEADKG